MGKRKQNQSFIEAKQYGEPPKEIGDIFYGMKLDEEQRVFANAIWSQDYDIVFCNSKAGTGKAQPTDTIIPTPAGNVRLGDIRVGDSVFDADGNPTTVLGVFNQGMQEAFRVTFNDGRSTICAKEHLWTYFGYSNNLVTETLESMMQRSVIVGSRGARYSIPACGAVQYKEQEQKVDPYVMGVFLGDGSCSCKYLSLSSEDEELVGSVAKILGYTYKKNTDKNYTWSFYDNGRLVKTEDVFGDYPEVMATCDLKRIPYEYIYASEEQRYSLLQGLFDTDGCIVVAENRFNVRYTSVNKQMIVDLLQIIYSLGFSGRITEDFREQYSGGVCYNTNIRVPNSIKHNLFRLHRKKDIALMAHKTDSVRKYDRLAIRDIEDLGYECEMVCIYVDNDKHLYLTNDYIVTHNTTITTGVANLLVKYGFFDNIVYVMCPYGEKTQGWLPGSIEEKSAVYFEPFYQALVTCNVNPYTALNNGSMENQKNGTGYITCITDTFLRGQNLNNAVVILDEAQNYTAPQLKKILTRIGEKAKVVVIGHDKQCDLRDKSASGFVKYVEHFRGMERATFCTLINNHRGWISQHADEFGE